MNSLARPRLIVVASPASANEESGGLVVTDREVGVVTDRLGGATSVQRFPVTRTVGSADALRDAVISPLVEALLSRRLQTEEAAIFTLGDARSCDAQLVSECLRSLLNGLASSPRELVASVQAVHAADAHSTPLSREIVTDLLQPVSAGHRGSAAASEVVITSATRGARLLLSAADARPARACVLMRLVARMPRNRGDAPIGNPCLHLVLLPPSESLASGPAAVSFSFLSGALSALSGGDASGVPPVRSSKLMLLLRDVLRPPPPSAHGLPTGSGSPAQFLCVACVSHARERSDHALSTLKLATRLCAPSAKHPAVAAWRAAAPREAPHPAQGPWEVEGYEASLWAPSAVAGVANAFVAASMRDRMRTGFLSSSPPRQSNSSAAPDPARDPRTSATDEADAQRPASGGAALASASCSSTNRASTNSALGATPHLKEPSAMAAVRELLDAPGHVAPRIRAEHEAAASAAGAAAAAISMQRAVHETPALGLAAPPPSTLLDTIAAREAALRELDETLTRREELIDKGERALEVRAHLQSAVAELAARDADVSGREASVAEAEQRVVESERARKATHEAREAGIDAREEDLRHRETALGDAEVAQRDSEKELAARWDDATLQVRAREESVAAREGAVAGREERMVSRENEVETHKEAADEMRRQALVSLDGVARREQLVSVREIELSQKEIDRELFENEVAELERRRGAMEAEAVEIGGRQLAVLAAREVKVASREEIVAEREEATIVREKEMLGREREVELAAEGGSRAEGFLSLKQAELAKRESALDAGEAELTHAKESLTLREEAASRQEAAVLSDQDAVREQRLAADGRAEELHARSEEIRATEERLRGEQTDVQRAREALKEKEEDLRRREARAAEEGGEGHAEVAQGEEVEALAEKLSRRDEQLLTSAAELSEMRVKVASMAVQLREQSEALSAMQQVEHDLWVQSQKLAAVQQQEALAEVRRERERRAEALARSVAEETRRKHAEVAEAARSEREREVARREVELIELREARLREEAHAGQLQLQMRGSLETGHVELSRREAELQAETERLRKQVAEMGVRAVALDDRHAELRQSELKLETERREMRAREEEAQRARAAERSGDGIRTLEAQLRSAQTEVDLAEARIRERELAVLAAEEMLGPREEGLERAEALVARREQASRVLEGELAARQMDLEAQEIGAKAHEEVSRVAEASVAAAREAMLRAAGSRGRHSDAPALTSDTEAREAAAAAREAAAFELEAEVARREAALEARLDEQRQAQVAALAGGATAAERAAMAAAPTKAATSEAEAGAPAALFQPPRVVAPPIATARDLFEPPTPADATPADATPSVEEQQRRQQQLALVDSLAHECSRLERRLVQMFVWAEQREATLRGAAKQHMRQVADSSSAELQRRTVEASQWHSVAEELATEHRDGALGRSLRHARAVRLMAALATWRVVSQLAVDQRSDDRARLAPSPAFDLSGDDLMSPARAQTQPSWQPRGRRMILDSVQRLST